MLAVLHKNTQVVKKEKETEVVTQSMWYEVEEGVTQQPTGGEAQQHFEQILVLVAVGLNWDQKQDEERSRTNQQGGSNSLQTKMEEGVYFLHVLYSHGAEDIKL